MDEARRFLRYVLPGLVLILQILLVLYLNNELTNFDNFVNIGSAIVTFLASGVLGFIFSNLYYIIYWEFYLRLKRFSKLNYLELIRNNKSRFKDHMDNKPANQKEAWSILNVYFNLNHGKKLSYFERKTDSISNVLAAIGTSFVILFCGFFIFEFLFLSCLKARLIFLAANLFVSVILLWNYQIAANILQNLYVRIFEWIKEHPQEN